MESLHRSLAWAEKLAIAAGLILLSALLYALWYLFIGDLDYIAKYVYMHLAFLPIHALVLGIILNELISFREKITRRKKLNMFLGIFFRQMGVDILLKMAEPLENRQEYDQLILVGKDWKRREFRRARKEIAQFKPKMRADAKLIRELMELLADHEADLMSLTRNPMILEMEKLHRGLMSLIHLLEEMHFRPPLERLSRGELAHLARDVSKALLPMAQLWLTYLEHLKAAHPALFHCQIGVCNLMEPLLLEEVEVD